MAAIAFDAACPLTVAAEFQPLDPGIVSAEIPAFFIGRNREGASWALLVIDTPGDNSPPENDRLRRRNDPNAQAAVVASLT